ncbi:hypothetical protein RHMOL_Rhmol05G0098100 [Rhododendron molle]|uniref:Uncharacterized protein n=1 Tax=Rhododendron molle TaxID=49168 RepID=A0ACC0NP99_RHOML|nr:hypothetical protein RHMOL_Rhmol05G0098100 [Rhododendron molle]
MTPQEAQDLIYVHNNLLLLSRRTRVYTEGDTKLWDVGGDAFDSLEEGDTKLWDVGGDAFDSLEGAGILEIANLSLDESEMEAVTFNDEGKVDAIEVDK